jgi:hypothetical protein
MAKVPAAERAGAAAWLQNLTVSAAATASWVENASRTSAEPFRKDTAIYDFSVGASHHQQVAPNWLLNAGLEADWQAVPEFTRAGYANFAPRLSLQRKFGLGPLAPVLQFETALPYKVARLGQDRGWGFEASLRLAKRLTETFKAGTSLQWVEHNARSAVFDLNQHAFSIDAAWDVSERWSVSGNVGRLSGDVVANAAWSVWSQAITGGLGPAVFNYYTSRPWEITEVYGRSWVSYNVEAHVDQWSLAATYAVSERTTAELRYASAFVVNKIGVRYPTDSWGLSVVHRF